MNPIVAALRHPLSVMVALVALTFGFCLAIGKPVCEQLGIKYPAGLPEGMDVDIFPALNLPVIYVCQPYGGMDPAQMEGLSDQLLRVPLPLHQRHPPRRVAERAGHGADEAVLSSRAPNMAQAMAETINYVNRSRAFMPPGTVSPFVMRFDTGSVPVGYLVLSSDTRIDRRDSGPGAVFGAADVRQPAGRFGAAAVRRQRADASSSRVDPQRLQSYGMSPDEVVDGGHARATRSARRATCRSATSIRSCR